MHTIERRLKKPNVKTWTRKDGTVVTKEYNRRPTDVLSAKEVLLDTNTISGLITAYQRSPEWKNLAPLSKLRYINDFKAFDVTKNFPVAGCTRPQMKLMRDWIVEKRGQGAARNFVSAVHKLFKWAIEGELAEHNPMSGLLKGLKNEPYPTWKREEVAVALARFPEHLRRVVVLAAWTGLRVSDLCELRWSQFDGKVIRLTAQKNKMEIVHECHPTLIDELYKWQRGTVVGIGNAPILLNAQGKQWTRPVLSATMSAARKRIGIQREVSMHGLRKFFATRIALSGGTSSEVMAGIADRSLQEADRYTKDADRAHLLRSAIARLSPSLTDDPLEFLNEKNRLIEKK